MARKGNQQRNGLDRNSSNQKIRVSETGAGSLQEKKERVEACEGKVVDGEELPNGNPSVRRRNRKKSVGEGKESKQKSKETPIEEKPRLGTNADVLQSATISSNPREPGGDVSASDASKFCGENGASLDSDHSLKNPTDRLGCSEHGLRTKDMMEGSGSSDTMVGRSLGDSALSILNVVNEWLERQKPLFTTIKNNLLDACDYVHLKILQAYPIVCRWLLHFGNLLLLVSLLWLDCSIRGLGSFMRLGTTSFFSVIWCSIISVIAMIGISKFLMIMVSFGDAPCALS
ncbi:hypothetical protein BVC80_379g102 [Macleaya cordata]|uniref:Uncharacterized protein n=1 Tax=Macleaya cordata TaxID=56857 RepID=A0A200QT04_MACCD|nr:hypothetical protein BVC80_379g102 [Macleaya cordata]